MNEEVRRLEREKLKWYGKFKVAETKADDIGFIVTIISIFGYCLFLVTIGNDIIPEATTLIGKSIGGAIVLGSIILIPNIIGNVAFIIAYKALGVKFKYQVYDNTSWILRDYLNYLR